MTEVKKFIPFVKSQRDFHKRQADRFKADSRRLQLHSGTADTFQELLEFLENMPANLSPSLAAGSGVSLGWSELQDLPDELVQELSITESDKLDYSIAELISQQGGIASLDRILVEIFKLTGEILKRQNLNARLYRMVQKGMIFSVPGRKGVYSSAEIESDNNDSDIINNELI